jgi:hypothetical protein
MAGEAVSDTQTHLPLRTEVEGEARKQQVMRVGFRCVRRCPPAKRAVPLGPNGAVWMNTALSIRSVNPCVNSTDM